MDHTDQDTRDVELRLGSPPFGAYKNEIRYLLDQHSPLKILDAADAYEHEATRRAEAHRPAIGNPYRYLKGILSPKRSEQHRGEKATVPRVRVPTVGQRWSDLLTHYPAKTAEAARAMISGVLGRQVALCDDEDGPSDELMSLYMLCDVQVRSAVEATQTGVPVGEWLVDADAVCERLRGLGLSSWAGWYARLAQTAHREPTAAKGA